MKYIVIIMMTLLILTGCSTEARQTESPSLTAVHAVNMKYDQVEKTYISIGEAVPNNQIDIYATGDVDLILKSVGEPVISDETLLLLEDDNVTASYLASESQLRTIRDNLKSQYDQSKLDFENQDKLFTAGIITKSQYDQSENQMNSLYRQYLDANTNYRNQVKNLKESVNDKALVSPIDGTVAAIYVSEGESLSNRLAISVVDKSKVFIKTFISSDLKRLLEIGDSVTIYVDGDRDEPHKGLISKINEIPDSQTKLFEIHIEAADSYDYIIGEYTEIEYIVSTYMAYMVPTSSIVRSNTESYVYLLEDDSVEKVRVTTGLSKDDWIEVGEINQVKRVLIRGQNNVVDGEKVQEIE
ncbi:efflux RND transporter periplasmic adaptor subunit [Acidaminobacter sp. JC074]|uniref:efflux RND transporter periplasmic adaptor subunit n=1 Tax=Acidaminobacter sp. JC074 TaxID=2530199 RepID=UPI001F0E59C3|nr:efflux RND transporter periplasmic adaptor subunit [Acidaminobacter sp. JC074]MCH4888452.1 efflux RND transporter periplasmic adaptor subunit [Acidaminobacter sp. JC074]